MFQFDDSEFDEDIFNCFLKKQLTKNQALALATNDFMRQSRLNSESTEAERPENKCQDETRLDIDFTQ